MRQKSWSQGRNKVVPCRMILFWCNIVKARRPRKNHWLLNVAMPVIGWFPVLTRMSPSVFLQRVCRAANGIYFCTTPRGYFINPNQRSTNWISAVAGDGSSGFQLWLTLEIYFLKNKTAGCLSNVGSSIINLFINPQIKSSWKVLQKKQLHW